MRPDLENVQPEARRTVGRPTLRIGTLALTVRDLERTTRFYRDVVGLRALDSDGDGVRLGTRAAVLLELRRDADARLGSPHEAGLYHAAFLLPDRAALGAWMRHAARHRFPLGGLADHRVSEAVYLSDPEGNGVEIYSDRPRETWTWSGDTVAMTTDPLDVAALMREAGQLTWDGAPDGTSVGHVHFKVGEIASAEAFYAGVLGVPVTARYPGGSFFGADRYHHHFAANIWSSRGAGPRRGPATGLAEVGILVAEAATIDAIERRAGAAGIATTRRGPLLALTDPWGTSLTLTGPGT